MPRVSAVGKAKPAGRRRAPVAAQAAKPTEGRVFQHAMREAVDAAKAAGTTDRGILQTIAIKARADFLAGKIE